MIAREGDTAAADDKTMASNGGSPSNRRDGNRRQPSGFTVTQPTSSRPAPKLHGQSELFQPAPVPAMTYPSYAAAAARCCTKVDNDNIRVVMAPRPLDTIPEVTPEGICEEACPPFKAAEAHVPRASSFPGLTIPAQAEPAPTTQEPEPAREEAEESASSRLFAPPGFEHEPEPESEAPRASPAVDTPEPSTATAEAVLDVPAAGEAEPICGEKLIAEEPRVERESNAEAKKPEPEVQVQKEEEKAEEAEAQIKLGDYRPAPRRLSNYRMLDRPIYRPNVRREAYMGNALTRTQSGRAVSVGAGLRTLIRGFDSGNRKLKLSQSADNVIGPDHAMAALSTGLRAFPTMCPPGGALVYFKGNCADVLAMPSNGARCRCSTKDGMCADHRELLILDADKITRQKKVNAHSYMAFGDKKDAREIVRRLGGRGCHIRLLDEPELDETKIYVANLPPAVTEEELTEVLTSCGTVASAKILRDCHGVNRGVGFVRMSTEDQAVAAIQFLHDRELIGWETPLQARLAYKYSKKVQMERAFKCLQAQNQKELADFVQRSQAFQAQAQAQPQAQPPYFPPPPPQPQPSTSTAPNPTPTNFPRFEEENRSAPIRPRVFHRSPPQSRANSLLSLDRLFDSRQSNRSQPQPQQEPQAKSEEDKPTQN